jgi:hypothetical protein
MTSKADLIRQWSERSRQAVPEGSGRIEMLQRAIEGAAANEFGGGGKSGLPRPLVNSLPTEVLENIHARFTLDLESRVRRHDLIWGEPHGPSADWTRGAMLGNGDLGVAVYGFPDNLSMAFGKTDLWDRRDPGRGFLPQCTFAELRRCYERQDEAEYQRLSATLPTYPLPCFLPAGVLRLRVAEAAINARCSQHHNLYRGTSETSFLPAGQYQQGQLARGKLTTVRSLVSQPHEVLLTRLIPGVYPLGPVGVEYSRSPEPDVPPPEISTAGQTLLLRYRLPAGDSYVVGIRSDHEVAWQQAGHRLLGDIDATEGELVLYSTVVTELDAPDPIDLARARLEAAAESGADEVEEHHCQWWESYWNRGYLTIDDDDAERGWYRALYVCGACLRADYHANLNIQATYWSCFTANRLDLVEPLLAFYLNALPRCRRDTREFFQMQGSYLPHACDIFGNPTGNAAVLPLLASMTPTCWLASMFWDYYDYSGDLDYLRAWGYPLLREVTRFSEDYLSFENDRGMIEPSICWEVNTGSLEGWGKNSQYDLAAVRRLWQVVFAAAEVLGVDRERRSRALDAPSGPAARLPARRSNNGVESVPRQGTDLQESPRTVVDLSGLSIRAGEHVSRIATVVCQGSGRDARRAQPWDLALRHGRRLVRLFHGQRRSSWVARRGAAIGASDRRIGPRISSQLGEPEIHGRSRSGHGTRSKRHAVAQSGGYYSPLSRRPRGLVGPVPLVAGGRRISRHLRETGIGNTVRRHPQPGWQTAAHRLSIRRWRARCSAAEVSRRRAGRSRGGGVQIFQGGSRSG